MATGHLHALVRQMSRRTGPDGVPADAELLRRFVSARDEAAFELLVWRHRAMVLGLCRRVLRHEQDVEDAFQATFLALLRAAGSIGGESVGGWLYKVAYRVALRARADSARRARREQWAANPEAEVPGTEVVWRDVRPVLDEELGRLPAAYRESFVLCCIEGKTVEEAARELGCPRSTVGNRLARARSRLRSRLARRGLTLTPAVLAAVVSRNAASASIPSPLLASAIKAAADPAIPARVVALTEGALRAMSHSKKLTAALILAAGVLTAGVGVLAHQPPAAPFPPAPVAAAPDGREDPRPRVDLHGDPLPPGALARLGTLRLRHRNVTAVAFAPDGSILVAGDRDGLIRFWDRRNGAELRRTSAHQGAVTAVAMSSDWKYLASGGPDQVNAARFAAGQALPAGAVSARAVSLAKGAVQTMTAAKPAIVMLIFTVAGVGIGFAVFGPRGEREVTASRPAPETREAQPTSVPDRPEKGDTDPLPAGARARLGTTRFRHGGPVSSLAYLSGGKVLASAGHVGVMWDEHQPGKIRLWEAATGKELRQFQLKGNAHLAASPDGTILAGVDGGDGTIFLWDAASGKELHRLKGGKPDPDWPLQKPIAFSPDGKILGAIPFRGNDGLRLWDVGTGQLLRTEKTSQTDNPVYALAFSPDGKILAYNHASPDNRCESSLSSPRCCWRAVPR